MRTKIGKFFRGDVTGIIILFVVALVRVVTYATKNDFDPARTGIIESFIPDGFNMLVWGMLTLLSFTSLFVKRLRAFTIAIGFSGMTMWGLSVMFMPGYAAFMAGVLYISTAFLLIWGASRVPISDEAEDKILKKGVVEEWKKY